MRYEVFYSNKLMTRFDSPTGFSPAQYTKVGQVEARDVQDLFRKLNGEDHLFPRSLSVGDVVREEGSDHYLMCWFSGWQRVD
jgi:hypothetical protein